MYCDDIPMDSAALTILHSVTRLGYAWNLFDDKFSYKSSPNFGIFWKSLLYKNFCGHFWATFVKWTIFKKYGPNPPSWDSHLIPQDGRCRRIHWAMVAPLNGLFLFQLLVALIRELTPPPAHHVPKLHSFSLIMFFYLWSCDPKLFVVICQSLSKAFEWSQSKLILFALKQIATNLFFSQICDWLFHSSYLYVFNTCMDVGTYNWE